MFAESTSRWPHIHVATVAVLLLLLGAMSNATTARAAALRVPSSAYPAGSHIGVRPDLSNARMDCLWGFDCENGRPNFHLHTQDALRRLGGWAQFAGVQKHDRATMGFELFVSHYNSPTDAMAAFADFRAAVLEHGYNREWTDAALLTGPRISHTLTAVTDVTDQNLVVMCIQSGSAEIEGITFYDRGSRSATRTARASLALQIRIAVDQGD